MAKKESIMRYSLIINKLRKKPSAFSKIEDYLALESEIQSYDFNISKRTFHRDIADIRSIYNIDIEYDQSRKVYYIDLDDSFNTNGRILEAFDTFQALNISDRLSNYIRFEKRRPQGTENLHGLLRATKNKKQITFQYRKFDGEEATERIVEPYSLIEAKYRWYILAKDLNDQKVKSFALDRLTDLEITNNEFQLPEDFDVNEHYKHSFGIMSPNANGPSEVVLSFNPYQGKFVKTLPLHSSQKILIDDENEFRIELTVYLTHDFFMEIMSFGEHIKVIKPMRLVKDVEDAYKNALALYKK